MVLHLGSDVIVPIREVVAILGREPGAGPDALKQVLGVAAREGRVYRIGTDEVKSRVLVNRQGQSLWYLSPISPATLQSRAAKKIDC